MSRKARFTAVAAAAALTVPLAVTAAATPAAAEPVTAANSFDSARANLLAAAYTTQRVAQEGFHVVTKSSLGESRLEYRLEGWVSGYGDAALKMDGGSAWGPPIYQGSNFMGSANGPRLEAWTRLDPQNKWDRKVMNRLPNGMNTRFAVGPAPANTLYSTNGFGFTAEQVTQSLDRTGMMPWNAADMVAMCGHDDDGYTVTCTGDETVVNGTAKVWNFNVDSRLVYQDNEFVTNVAIVVKSNAAGLITSARYETNQEGFAQTVTSKADYSSYVMVPYPNVKKKYTVKSHILAKEAAKVGSMVIAERYTKWVDNYLIERGVPLTQKTAGKAGMRLMPNAFQSWPNTQWLSQTGYRLNDNIYSFQAVGTDGIAALERSATPYVMDGKWKIEQSGVPPFPGGVVTRAAAPDREAADAVHPLSPPLWEHVTK